MDHMEVAFSAICCLATNQPTNAHFCNEPKVNHLVAAVPTIENAYIYIFALKCQKQMKGYPHCCYCFFLAIFD